MVSIDDYREEISYDPNGNIKTYKRNGSGNNLNLNNYSYTYQNGTNKLISLKNSVDNKVSVYGYDAIGNVIKDEKQNVLSNTWNVYGKLQKVEKKDGKIITYSYDAAGNRISKTVGDTTEIYVRDASGNVMMTYQKNPTINSGHLSTKEFYKYGSNLLGVKKKLIDLEAKIPDSEVQYFVTGEDEYYLYDQRGNVLGSVSDKKIQHDENNDGLVDFYTAATRTMTMYSSYGAGMPGKSYNAETMTHGMNGQLKDKAIDANGDHYTALYWEYSSETGRRWNLDPKPNPSISPYATFENNPIWNTDPLGDTLAPILKGIGTGIWNFAKGIVQALEPVKIPEPGSIDVAAAFGMVTKDQAKQEMAAMKGKGQQAIAEYITESTLGVLATAAVMPKLGGKNINISKVKVSTGISSISKAGNNIALGVREHLGDFAKNVKGSTWETWGSKNFQTQFLETINNSANKIHFNLDGIGNPWKAIADGSKGFGVSEHVTSWELHQIYSNPAVLERTTFYQGGKIVPNPFK